MGKNVGIIGLGDMGMGLAKNLINNGFQVTGFDLREKQIEELKSLGGTPASNVTDVGGKSDAVFVMVMNGNQVKNVASELLESLKDGSTIICTATIHPHEMRETEELIKSKNSTINLIDTPVAGGLPGAQNGTLTLMAAAKTEVFENNKDVLDAISAKIFHVGEEPGLGQTVKATLQSLIGTVFSGIFETLVLGSKAGVSGKVMFDVISNSGVGCGLFNNCAPLIMDRKFKGTGSQIATMYKDLGITLNMAKDTGVPLYMASTAFEMFQAGITKYPENDNWTIVKVLEDIVGTEVKW